MFKHVTNRLLGNGRASQSCAHIHDERPPQSEQSKNAIIKTTSTEQEELENKCRELARLELQLAEQELLLLTVRSELDLFSAEYRRLIGARYAELDDIEAQIAELLASVTPSDAAAQENKVRARHKAQQTAREMGAEDPNLRQEPPETQKKFSVGQDIKKLFRDVAKRLHPDLAGSSDELVIRNRLMAEANEAYRNGDSEALQRILETWENSPEAVIGNSLDAELERVLRKIQQILNRLIAIEGELQELRSSKMYCLKEEADAKEKVGESLFAEMCAALDERIAYRREHLNTLRERLNQSEEIHGDEYWG
jgi:hypothetical protein